MEEKYVIAHHYNDKTMCTIIRKCQLTVDKRSHQRIEKEKCLAFSLRPASQTVVYILGTISGR